MLIGATMLMPGVTVIIAECAMPETAKVFEHREKAGHWRVEWIDEDGGCEVAIFAGAHARDRAIRYANSQYGSFEATTLAPYRR
jgi:hypothetical protein